MKLTKFIVTLFSLCIITGCSIKAGGFNSETHFSFPNSNVTPLGQVKSTLSRWSFFASPVEGDDALNLVNEAIAQKPGADLMLNYILDTKITIFPPLIYKTEMVVEGTAAKMEIGEQELENTLNQVKYRSFKHSIK